MPFLSQDELRNRILRRLGHPTIQIELTNEQIDDSIQEAIEEYATEMGATTYHSLSVSSAQTTYDLSSFEIDDVVDVQYISFGVSQLLFGGMYETGAVPWKSMQMTANNYRGMLESVQTTRQVYGATLDWEYVRDTKTLFLSVPDKATTAVIQGAKIALDLGIVKNAYWSDFFKVCVGKAKSTLGLVRRKYSGVKIPGSDLTLDGEALATEGKMEVDEVLKKWSMIKDDYIQHG